MDYLEFIARVTSHIPDKGQVLLSFPSSSDPANPVFWLNLTPDDAAVYHPQRWDKRKFVLERSFDKPGKKQNAYSEKEDR